MNIKTLNGPSIHEALIEARALFGDEVMLLESVPATEGRPAQITVLTDQPLPRPAQPQPPQPQPPQPERQTPAQPAPPAALPAQARQYGYAAAARPRREPAVATATTAMVAPADASHPAARPAPRPAAQRPQIHSAATLLDQPLVAESREPAPPPAPPPALPPAGTVTRRGRLFPVSNANAQAAPSPARTRSAKAQPPAPVQAPVQAADAVPPARPLQTPSPVRKPSPKRPVTRRARVLDVDGTPITELLHNQATTLRRQLKRIERRLDDVLAGSAHAWMAHPLYSGLLRQGLPPHLVCQVFNRLTLQGYAPQTKPETIKALLIEGLGQMMTEPATHRPGVPLMMIGPGGSGKSSLILRLAREKHLLGCRKPAVIVLLPQDADAPSFQDPVTAYNKYKLPVVAVRTPAQIKKVLPYLKLYDQVLIDTPALPVRTDAAQRALRRLKALVAPLPAVHVQFVLNTTRTLDYFTADYFEAMPLPPQSLALTHLDETLKLGRIAGWLEDIGLPVRFAATRAGLADGVRTFTPQWFARALVRP